MIRPLSTLALAAAFLGFAAGGGRAQDATVPAQAPPAAPAAEPVPNTVTATVPGKGEQRFTTGLIPAPRIRMPEGGTIAGEVFLISDADGWGDDEDDLADTLVDEDAIVIGIDLPSTLAALESNPEDCVYLVSDIEDLNQQTQRAAGDTSLSLPIVAGLGTGASLALAILAQTPDNTIAATVAVDPDGGIPLKKDLCTQGRRHDRDGRAIYALEDRALPDPVTISFTDAAADAGRIHAAALQDQADGVTVADVGGEDPATQLGILLNDLLDQANDADPDAMGLPLTILDAKPTRDTLAIIYSGDGGWRDLDKEVGDIFQKEGVPTVGVDSLRYFWTKQAPEKVAQDLAAIIDRFRKRWKVGKVLLIGYSFGADILPAAFEALPPDEKKSVAMLSLLAFSQTGDYQISVAGWLGVDNGGDTDGVKAAAKIPPGLIQCVFGTEDDENACGKLDSGVEKLGIEGGHHFDEDYPALAAKILAALDRRLKPDATAAGTPKP